MSCRRRCVWSCAGARVWAQTHVSTGTNADANAGMDADASMDAGVRPAPSVRASPRVSLDSLSDDTLAHTLSTLDPVSLLVAGRASQSLRAAVRELTHHAQIDVHLPHRWEINRTQLRDVFCLTESEAADCDFRREQRRGRYGPYETCVLPLATALARGLRVVGGWERLACRLARRRERASKLKELADRQSKAPSKRSDKLEAWAREEGLLDGENDLETWRNSFTLDPVHESPLLLTYLTRPVLRAPMTLAEAKREFHAVRDNAAQHMLKREIHGEVDGKREELRRALARLELPLRDDSKLSRAFLTGSCRHTVEVVAATAAYMRWLREHTHYGISLADLVRRLRDSGWSLADVNYFAGARVRCRSQYRPPATWPWLSPKRSRRPCASTSLPLLP